MTHTDFTHPADDESTPCETPVLGTIEPLADHTELVAALRRADRTLLAVATIGLATLIVGVFVLLGPRAPEDGTGAGHDRVPGLLHSTDRAEPDPS